jgi:predicted DNA-binding ribbon-helix-helix protein
MAELEASDNPFGVVVLAHLQAQAKRQDTPERKEVKLNLVRRLYERGYPRQDVINLFRFLDWCILLSKPLEQEFWQALRAFEEERNMPYITSVERIGAERGERIGFERGVQHERGLILRQLTRQVGELPADLTAQVQALPLPQLEALGDALLDFRALSDLQSWLAEPQP